MRTLNQGNDGLKLKWGFSSAVGALLLTHLSMSAVADDGFDTLRDPAAPSEPEGIEAVRREAAAEETCQQLSKQEEVRFGLDGGYSSGNKLFSSRVAIQYRADNSRWSLRVGGHYEREFPRWEGEEHSTRVQANASVAPAFLRTNRFTTRTGFHVLAEDNSESNSLDKGLEWKSEASFESLMQHVIAASVTVDCEDASNVDLGGRLSIALGEEVSQLKGLSIGTSYERSYELMKTSDSLTGSLEMSVGRALVTLDVGTSFDGAASGSLSLSFSKKLKPRVTKTSL